MCFVTSGAGFKQYYQPTGSTEYAKGNLTYANEFTATYATGGTVTGPFSTFDAMYLTYTAADTTAPSAPSNLTATATGSSSIQLSWMPSTDNIGVTGYRVERCAGASCSSFTQVATTTSASFLDSVLASATTYRYRVRASDAAGNLSAYSSIQSATTTTTGTVFFDGRATLLTQLVSHEVFPPAAYTNGPITWTKTPYGTHYFYTHQTPAPHQAGTPAYRTHTCRLHGTEEILWSCPCFIKDDISLYGDSRYAQVYRVRVTIGDTNQWQGSAGGTRNGAGQLTVVRPTDLGSWKWYAMAVKINSWSGSASDINNAEILSLGYQVSSGSQITFALGNNGGALSYQMHANAGYANGIQGQAAGTTHFQENFLPVTLGRWDEFIIGVKWATDKTGALQVHHRVPGGVWSQVFNKTGIDTELYGPIYASDGVTLIKNFAQDASNWGSVTDKMGLYYAMGGLVVTETVYESGFITTGDLATAKATFPE
jgi:hypothetical protein